MSSAEQSDTATQAAPTAPTPRVVSGNGHSALQTVDASDPGDETQRRFRYQATYAACLAIGILDPESGLDEIFCEHHEDIIAVYSNTDCVGIQVKTRLDGSIPFKSGDDEVIRSIQR